MTSPPDNPGNQNRNSPIPPEFSGGTPWVVTMDDGQRKAHAKQMEATAKQLEASAYKTKAEADEILSHNSIRRLRLVCSYALTYMVTVAFGFLFGVLYCANS